MRPVCPSGSPGDRRPPLKSDPWRGPARNTPSRRRSPLAPRTRAQGYTRLRQSPASGRRPSATRPPPRVSGRGSDRRRRDSNSKRALFGGDAHRSLEQRGGLIEPTGLRGERAEKKQRVAVLGTWSSTRRYRSSARSTCPAWWSCSAISKERRRPPPIPCRRSACLSNRAKTGAFALLCRMLSESRDRACSASPKACNRKRRRE